MRTSSEPRVARCRRAFTLIEILVVVAIMGIVLTISVPFLNTSIGTPKGLNGAVRAVQDVCKTARDWAILRQQMMTLEIRGDGTFQVSSGGGSAGAGHTSSPSVDGGEWRMETTTAPTGKMEGTSSYKLPDDVAIEGIWIGGRDVMDLDVVRVLFHKDGTSDELSVVLLKPETNERRNVLLEVVTGLADIESDPAKFKTR